MKPKLLVGIASLAISAGCLPLRTPTSDYAKESSKLYVNTNEKHYTMKKSRQAGEEDLLALTKSQPLEEAWIYTKHKDGSEQWDECGIREEAGKVSIVYDFKKMGLESIAEISFYHIQPETKGGRDDYSQVLSLSDFYCASDLIISLNKESKSLASRMDFRVVVPTGVYALSFDKSLFEDAGAWDTMLRLYDFIWLDLMLTTAMKYREANRESFTRLNREFAERYTNKYLKIRFEEAK